MIVCGKILPRPVGAVSRLRRAKELIESRSDTIADIPGPLVEAFPVTLAIFGL
jgi:hypothetical protein